MAYGPPSRAFRTLNLTMGYSTLEAGPVAMAVFGRQIGRAAITLAFQNIFLLAAIVAATATLPAVLINRYGQRIHREAR